MPKARLEFDLPLERIEFEQAARATDLYLLVCDVLEYCRVEQRYKFSSEEVTAHAEWAEGVLRDAIKNRGLVDVFDR